MISAKRAGILLIGLMMTATVQAAPTQQQTAKKDRTLAFVEASSLARQALLENSFNAARPNLEKFLKNFPFPDQITGARPEDCTPEKIAAMGPLEVFTKCPGIADYFFKDGGWIPNFFPRPVKIELKNLKITDIKFDNTDITCEGTDCTIAIPLNKLNLSVDVNIININKSSRVEAGESLFNFNPLKFNIAPSQGETPVLVFKSRLGSTENGGSPLIIDTQTTQLKVPTGSLSFELPKNGHNTPLGELINGPGKLSIGGTAFSLLAGFAGTFMPELAELNAILDFNMGLNEHFQHEEKVAALNRLINNQIGAKVLATLNDAIAKAPFFKGMTIKVPGKAGAEAQVGLKGIIAQAGEFDHFQFRVIETDCTDGNGSGAQDQEDEESYDLKGEISLKAINDHLNKLKNLGLFDNLVESVTLPSAPQILWDEAQGAHYLEVGIAVGSAPAIKVRLQFKATACQDGALCLTQSHQLPPELLGHAPLFQKVVENIFTNLSTVNPVLKNLPRPEFTNAPGAPVVESGLEQKVQIPQFSVVRVQGSPHAIKFYANLNGKH